MFRRFGLIAISALSLLVACREPKSSGSVAGKIEVRPSKLDFAQVAVYDGRTLSFAVENYGRGPVEILDISVEGPERTYRLELPEDDAKCIGILRLGDRCDLTIHFTPLDPGELPARLVIRSDSEGQERLEIPIQGVGVDARAIVPQDPVDFGRIELDAEKRVALPFRNPSPLPVRVFTRPLGADRDEFAAEEFELQPGEERQIDVAFRPTRVGTKRAALSVATCRGCPPVILPLRAVGLEQAVVAEPAEVNLGQVPVDREVIGMIRLRNLSTEPMQLTQLALARGSDPSFTVGHHAFPLVLAPFGTVEYPVRYVPSHMGTAESVGLVGVVSRRHPFTRVQFRAFGGSPELCISPLHHDFGTPPVGARIPLNVSIKNCGASNGDPLVIHGVSMAGGTQGGEDQYSLHDPGLPRTLRAGEEVVVRTFFEPTRPGRSGATLSIETSLASAPRVGVTLAADARQLPPCNLAIEPGAVDFGTVVPGNGAVLGVKLHNRGTDLCAVKNIRIADSAGDVFRMPGGVIEGHIIEPGWGFTFLVAAHAPRSGGTFVGALQIENADPANPVLTVPLSAHSQSSCLAAAPTFIDFGFARPDCPPGPRTVTLSNACPEPVTLNGLTIGEGTAEGEFVVTQRPGAGLTLRSGETVNVTVDYLAQVQGMNVSPLFLDVVGLPRPLLVPLVGESHINGQQLDSFVQQDGRKVDVLFVVDNTGSMVEEQPRFVQALPTFLNAARARSVDLQVAVTTTGTTPTGNSCPGGAEGGEAGRLFPVDNSRPRILNLQTPNVDALLQANAQVGMCSYSNEGFTEQGLEVIRRALSAPLVNNADDRRTPQPNDGNLGFVRDSAGLAVVFVSDEDDHSPDAVDDYIEFLQTVKGLNQPQRAIIYAIAPDGSACGTAGGSGTRYAEAARKTGGLIHSICAPDYAPALEAVAQKAFSPQSRFPLSSEPDPQGIHVFLNGTEQMAGWSYSAGDNSIVFDATPESGAKIDIRYRKRCN